MAYCADPGGEQNPGYKPEVFYLPQAVPMDDEDVTNVPPPPRRAELPPGQFVAMSRLQLEHLPAPIRSEAVLEAIEAVGARVVRVRVNRLSPARRGTFADRPGGLDEGCSNQGTGFAVYIHLVFVIVSTNRHVVFDDFEARHSTIEFFADDKETWRQDVRLFKGHGVISAHSDHDFALVVYWLQRGDDSPIWDPESVRCHKDLASFCFPHLAYTHAASPREDGAPKPEASGTSDITSHAGAKSKCVTSRADAPAEETETTAEKFVCVIAHPEGDTKHVSFGKILQENDVTQEVRHTAPTRNGSSGAPILIFSRCKTGVPPNNIWYHCSQLIEDPRIKVAKLQPNSAQLFAVEFNRGLVGWKLLSDLLDKLEPRPSQSFMRVDAEDDESLSPMGKGKPQEKDKEPPSGDLVTNYPSGLTVACKLLYWIYAAGQAMLHQNFLGLPQTSSSQYPAVVQPPPPPPALSTAKLPAPPSPQSPDNALVAAFQRLASQVSGLLGDEKVDSLMHPVSFLTLAKAVKDLHSAVHNHDPCCCRELSLCGDVSVPSAGLEPQSTSSASGLTTLLPEQERRTGCLLQSTLELLSAFLSDPGVTVLASLPVLNLLFRLATHLVRVVVLHQALHKTRTQTTEPEKATALRSTSDGCPTAVSTAARTEVEEDNGDGPFGDGHLDAGLGKRLLAELMAIFAGCFGSFLSISDAWTQVDQGWTKVKPSEATTKDLLDPSSGKLQSEKFSNPFHPDGRLLEKELNALQRQLQKSCSRCEKSTTPIDGQSPSTSQQEDFVKTLAVMAAIINAFPYMYRGLDDSQGRKNVCQRFQVVQGGDRSQEIRRLQGELESVLQVAHSVLALAKSAWEELQKVEDGSTQDSTPAAQGSFAPGQLETRSGATGNPEENQPKISDHGEDLIAARRGRAAGKSHDSSPTERAKADPRLSEDYSKTTEVQTTANQQQLLTLGTGIPSTEQSEFPPPSEPELEVFFVLNLIGFAALVETGRKTVKGPNQEEMANDPGVVEVREMIRKSGGRRALEGFVAVLTVDPLSPEDERFKAHPETFTEDNRQSRDCLVEGIRQLSDMCNADVPSLDDVVVRVRTAKEAAARQAAKKQEAEVSPESPIASPEAVAVDAKDSDTNQDSATESDQRTNGRRQGPEAGLMGMTEDQAASSQEQNATPQGDSDFLEKTIKTYSKVLEVKSRSEALRNQPQAMAPSEPTVTQPSQTQAPPSTEP